MQTNEVHFILQGKGGVGKSLTASYLTQYKAEQGHDLYCADTDPVNNTFSQYSAFNAAHVPIMGRNGIVDSRNFDGLIEHILEFPGTAIVDNGSSTFLPLSAYMVENSVVDLLQSHDKRVFLHCLITGGQAMDETLLGFKKLLESHRNGRIVAWENEFFGEVVKDGKTFVESNLYKNNKDRIEGPVRLYRANNDTVGKDVELMINEKLTFDQVQTSSKFSLMPRSRIKGVKKAIFEQLDGVNWE